jgi:hypothetical protein
MRTKVFNEHFKGYPMFSVWEVDDNDQKVGSYPLFSMGSKKAIALLKHIDDFMHFAEKAKEHSRVDINEKKYEK